MLDSFRAAKLYANYMFQHYPYQQELSLRRLQTNVGKPGEVQASSKWSWNDLGIRSMNQRFVIFAVFVAVGARGVFVCGAAEPQAAHGKVSATTEAWIRSYCLDCHNRNESTAEIDLESVCDVAVSENLSVWEQVVKKLRGGQMPPADSKQPTPVTIQNALDSLEQVLDAYALNTPQPGRTETFRRLTRFEYQNAIRDLLSIDIDATTLFPEDSVSHGFDNISVVNLSPSLISRYITAAQKISRLAIGRSLSTPDVTSFRIPADVTQEERVEGLPIGTRGGGLFAHTFPQDGEYEIQVRLARDRNEQIEGLSETHELEMLVDFDRVKLLTVKPPTRNANSTDEYNQLADLQVDSHLTARIPVPAGLHQIGVTFLKKSASLLETKRQPLNVHFNMYRHPRLSPAVYQVSIAGPLSVTGSGDPPSRRKVFVCQPTSLDDEQECARRIIATLTRQAFRQPIDEADLAAPLAIFQQVRDEEDFENSIEAAVSSILIHPKCLFRIERDPVDITPKTPYRVSDVELASRLSFFLWSSIPDNELLSLAEQGKLSDPRILEHQTRRMLADHRSKALVQNFAGQWLYLRNLDSITPDGRLYPDFDDNLRQAMRRETELFFESIVREDRSVIELLKSDYTYMNERLAKHYGVPHVYGSRFRRVTVDSNSHRGGLLRHASILLVTSYATRTSPVIRGKWILENILGSPPLPPPPDVPTLSDIRIDAELSIRERLAQHSQDPACASCHVRMDPAGFALENFDAVGRWREIDNGRPVDAVGGLPDGSTFVGVDGLEQGLLNRPEVFVATMTEKLLTYAVGRGVETFDAPAVRQVVREGKGDDFRFSSLILGIVNSTPFQYRMSP